MGTVTRAWIPNQHGAWAMLITPVLVGALLAGPTPWHLLLLAAWLAAYCASFFTGLAVKSRRPGRYQRQLLAYAAATVILGLPLAIQAPSLLWLVPAAIVAFAVNVAFILRRNERAWVNDAVGILLASCVGAGAVLVGGTPRLDAHALLALTVVGLYFLGTVVYVKTLIRERGSTAWRRASLLLHAAYGVAALVAHWWLAALIALALLARAALVPGRGWTPKRVGLTEIAWTLLVSFVALLGPPA